MMNQASSKNNKDLMMILGWAEMKKEKTKEIISKLNKIIPK